jgi:hypothetical protein
MTRADEHDRQTARSGCSANKAAVFTIGDPFSQRGAQLAEPRGGPIE